MSTIIQAIDQPVPKTQNLDRYIRSLPKLPLGTNLSGTIMMEDDSVEVNTLHPLIKCAIETLVRLDPKIVPIGIKLHPRFKERREEVKNCQRRNKTRQFCLHFEQGVGDTKPKGRSKKMDINSDTLTTERKTKKKKVQIVDDDDIETTSKSIPIDQISDMESADDDVDMSDGGI
jgi:hypothetical protein